MSAVCFHDTSEELDLAKFCFNNTKMFNFTKLPLKTYCLRYYLIKKSLNSINLVRPFLQVDNRAQMRLYNNTFQTSNLLKRSSPLFLDISRHKSKGRSKNKYNQQRDDDDEDEEEEDEGFDEDDDEKFKTHGVQVKTIQTVSARIDKVVKSALKVGRKRIEEIFYDNKLRLNEKKLLKKGAKVNVGDEIDIIKDVQSENPDRLTVTRIEILDMMVDEDKNVYRIKLKVSKSLLVDNYESERGGHEERTY